MHLTTTLKRAMTIAGEEIATIDGARARTWNECGARVARLAGALRGELGLAEGERAAILVLNSDRYFEFSHAMPCHGRAASSCRSTPAWRRRRSSTG